MVFETAAAAFLVAFLTVLRVAEAHAGREEEEDRVSLVTLFGMVSVQQ